MLGCTLIVGAKIGDLFKYVTCIISGSVIPLIFALALAMFVWGVVQYVINSDEEAKKAKGKQFMIWGIIGLAVMVSVWGLVKIVGNTFGIEYAIPQAHTQ
jgi:zinc transporter ZupT